MAAKAAEITSYICVRCCNGFQDVLVVYHDPKVTSEVFSLRAFVKSMGLCLIIGSTYHKNTNTKVELANCVITNTLHTYANGLVMPPQCYRRR